MKRVAVIGILLSFALVGCNRAVPTDPASGGASSQAAPSALLNAPNRARDAAVKANERTDEIRQAVPNTDR